MHKLALRAAAAVLFGTATAGFGPAMAGEKQDSYSQCLDKENSNPAWAACGNDEVRRQETRLNNAWKAKLGCFDRKSEAWQNLLEEQRLWIKWKDASCRFYWGNDAYGGPMFGRQGQVLDGPSCRAAVISQRASFLESLCKGID